MQMIPLPLEAQAMPTVVHFHHIWLVWILYYWGQAMHAAMQVDSQARKGRITRRAVLGITWIRILFRITAATALFLLVWDNPELIVKGLALIGHPISADEQSVLLLPMNNALALIYGLFSDSLLGYIPILKSQIPNLND